MDDWQRAITFLRAVDERLAEQVIPFRWGRALINRRLNLVHDANFVIADCLDGADAADLIEAAERLQGDLGLRHRRVNVDDRAAAERLAGDFERAGFLPERFLIMVRKRAPDRAPTDGIAQEVGWRDVLPSRQERRLSEPWATPELVSQMMIEHEERSRLVPTRFFAVMVDGKAVSSCELRTQADRSQIETVETLEPYRNRGYARAAVTAALDAARRQSFVFLVADRDDWPQHLYRKLGFDDVGVESRFVRLIDA